MNNDMLRTGLLSSCFLIMAAASAQYFPPDPAGLEGVIVEKYYVADANDAADTDGGSIAEGATVYRVYVDMLDGYKLQTVGGVMNHSLRSTGLPIFPRSRFTSNAAARPALPAKLPRSILSPSYLRHASG